MFERVLMGPHISQIFFRAIMRRRGNLESAARHACFEQREVLHQQSQAADDTGPGVIAHDTHSNGCDLRAFIWAAGLLLIQTHSCGSA